MTDILLVTLFPEEAYGINEGTIEPPLGVGYLAAVALDKNVSCRIIDANILRMKVEDVIREIDRDTPRIVGLSVNLYSYRSSIKLADELKKRYPDITVIMGGPTPSSAPVKVINDTKADAVVFGEGEETFAEIIDNYRGNRPLFKDVKGVIYRDGSRIVKNEARMFIRDVDGLSFPAYQLYPDLGTYKTRARKAPAAPILTSRGCPFECVYCSKDVFKNVCRMRSPENVIKEVDLLVKDYGVKQIDILDDNFTTNKKRTEEILDLLIERDYDLWVNLQTGVRMESLDLDMIRKMKKAKVWKLPVGVESGDPQILKKIKKRLNLDKVIEITQMAQKEGLKVYGFFMIGLPGDTAETMQRTIDFAIKMNPNVANFCITTPFPGTELYDMVKEEGRFLVDVDNGIDAGFYANEVFYEMGDLKRDDVLKYYKKAMRDFYFRPRKAFELLSGIRSKEEVRWLFDAGFSVIKNFRRGKNEKKKYS